MLILSGLFFVFLYIRNISAVKYGIVNFDITECGTNGTSIKMMNISMPKEITIGESFKFDIHVIVKEELPNDLLLNTKIQRAGLIPITIPCVNDIGSCPYDLCALMDMLFVNLCDILPEGQTCGCPINKGEFNLKGLEMYLPSVGLVVDQMMAGSFKAHSIISTSSDPDIALGCFDVDITLKKLAY